jgi:hypothetical protein
VLDGTERKAGSFDKTLQDALRDHTTRNAIRKVHLRGDDIRLLTTVVSSLIPEDRLFQDSNIESIALNAVDVSDLFSSQRFPKLRDLSLSGRFVISPVALDYLGSNTAVLVNLSLSSNSPSSILTTSQILSLLTSNPNIRSLALESLKIKDDSEHDFETRVPLRHLEKFSLKGDLHHLFPILRRLELPEGVDHARLEFYGHCFDAREIIAPYIRDYLLRDPRFKDRLGIFVSRTGGCVSLRASVIGVGYHGPDRLPQQGPPYATFSVTLPGYTQLDEKEKVCIDILALLPRESIVYFETNLSTIPTVEAIVEMPNLEALYLIETVVYYGFLLLDPDGLNPRTKLLPSLQRLYLQDPRAEGSDWWPLFHYAAYQTSDDHPFSLILFGEYTHICSELAEQIKGLVEEFVYDWTAECPFRECDERF